MPFHYCALIVVVVVVVGRRDDTVPIKQVTEVRGWVGCLCGRRVFVAWEFIAIDAVVVVTFLLLRTDRVC